MSPSKLPKGQPSATSSTDSKTELAVSPSADHAPGPTACNHEKQEKCDTASSVKHEKGDKFDFLSCAISLRGGEVAFHDGGIKDEEYYLQANSKTLEKIEDERAFPLFPEGEDLLIAPDELYEDAIFMKRPNLAQVINEETDAADAILQEARVMDKISRHPHPHIVRYFGCRVRRGRITGLVFERLPVSLYTMAVKQGEEIAKLDRDHFVARLRSAVAHIHGLGFAHRDIHPANIMVRDRQPVLIDFGLSGPADRIQDICGAPGWVRHFKDSAETSNADDDLYALGLLEERFTEEALRRVYLLVSKDTEAMLAQYKGAPGQESGWVGPYLEDGKEVWKPL